MKLSELRDTACPLARSMVAVGDWWSLLVVREVYFGSNRFSQIQRNLGIARNILSSRLKKLVECGVLRLQAGPGGHPIYELTEQGADLKDVLIAFARWGNRWLPANPDLVNPSRSAEPESTSCPVPDPAAAVRA